MSLIVLLSLAIIAFSQSLEIPYIDRVILLPKSEVKTSTLVNVMFEQCFCSDLRNISKAINFFKDNQTCQFFFDFPRRYRIQERSEARLYFPQGTFPEPSECCMPDFNELLAKLNNATMRTVNVSRPRCLAIDNHGYLVTIEEKSGNLKRFHLHNLTLHNTSKFTNNTESITYHQQAYYIGINSSPILTVDSNNLSIVNNLTLTDINNPRDLIFLRHGQIMVVASTNDRKLMFFNRSNHPPFHYDYFYNVSTSYSTPHGLLYVNDSFFYATSWDDNSIYSHAITNDFVWSETLFVNASSFTNKNGGSHVMIDDCQRRWFAIYDFGFVVYDHQGQPLGNFTRISTHVFDALFIDNYIMYISRMETEEIIRLDPDITC